MAAPQRHPDLDVENHHNNFALLFLSEKFEIMQHISPICLPQPDSPPAASEYCVSHGWGKDKFGASGRSVSQSVSQSGYCEPRTSITCWCSGIRRS